MITKFKDFLNENDGGDASVSSGGAAFATLSNTGGMGNVVAPQPGSVPGSYGTIGSGDLPAKSFGTYTKPMLNMRRKKKTIHRKKKTSKK